MVMVFIRALFLRDELAVVIFMVLVTMTRLFVVDGRLMNYCGTVLGPSTPDHEPIGLISPFPSYAILQPQESRSLCLDTFPFLQSVPTLCNDLKVPSSRSNPIKHSSSPWNKHP